MGFIVSHDLVPATVVIVWTTGAVDVHHYQDSQIADRFADLLLAAQAEHNVGIVSVVVTEDC